MPCWSACILATAGFAAFQDGASPCRPSLRKVGANQGSRHLRSTDEALNQDPKCSAHRYAPYLQIFPGERQSQRERGSCTDLAPPVLACRLVQTRFVIQKKVHSRGVCCNLRIDRGPKMENASVLCTRHQSETGFPSKNDSKTMTKTGQLYLSVFPRRSNPPLWFYVGC